MPIYFLMVTWKLYMAHVNISDFEVSKNMESKNLRNAHEIVLYMDYCENTVIRLYDKPLDQSINKDHTFIKS